MNYNSWGLWLAFNLLVAGYYAYAFFAPASQFKTALLPGTTTHGHYQIEMDCDACHSPSSDGNGAVGAFMQDACNRCHADQLQHVKDTHPAKKFNDPSNAELLQTLDAQNCLSCHQEHVPEQTSAMGLTIPTDYCWHCHQDVADSRPSHDGMGFDSCATAGCHNYHDNRAIYEKFLNDNFGQPDLLEKRQLPSRSLTTWLNEDSASQPKAIELKPDAPTKKLDAAIVADWKSTAHAKAGVSCNGCHQEAQVAWQDAVPMATCEKCHDRQTESFIQGRHGMRLARGLSPMKPTDARLPMHVDAAHLELTCNACHSDHRFDTQWAAVEACQQCHADSHSLAYNDSAHASLWQQELAGELPSGSGVTCASCHLPRLKDGDEVWVNHDQNANLRPNETMAREVCQSCHGLEFSLSALADPDLTETCFEGQPKTRTESVSMAHDWFQLQDEKRKQRQRNRKSN
ncbi:MAG: cytochrome c3 family protein [Rubripirellula sp.]